MKQKQTHGHRKPDLGLSVGVGSGESWTGRSGLVDANYFIENG